ncbi:MAG: hypothetical protein JO256_05390 [Alphaproteobacteria bacterium]|nr:hypothetical protein [Alphaproteobacteria bacterium]
MQETIREFEVRLFNDLDHQFLIVPVLVETEAEARAKAESLRTAHSAARYSLTQAGPVLKAAMDAAAAKPDANST